MNLEELLYAETHEWVHVVEDNGEKIATVGISAFAVEQLTDLVFMELPQVGTAVEAGNEFGEVESVKAVSPLYSPVSGEIVETNLSLPDNLQTLGEDPYEAGWIIKIKLANEFDLSSLLDHESYQRQCAEEG
ncbi:MAG: glycine cleavage system protein GcvH [Pirellulaceae bacterium]|nr:glycine cleavage system protein GcvH [Pirellulaceae bacterium]